MQKFLTRDLGISKEAAARITERFAAVEQERDAAKSAYEEARGALAELQGALDTAQHDRDEAQSAYAELQSIYEEADSARSAAQAELSVLQADFSAHRMDAAIQRALSDAGAKNLTAAGALIDKTLLTEEENGYAGLIEQVESIQKDCPYLFRSGLSSGMRHAPGGAAAVDSFTQFARTGAKLN